MLPKTTVVAFVPSNTWDFSPSLDQDRSKTKPNEATKFALYRKDDTEWISGQTKRRQKGDSQDRLSNRRPARQRQNAKNKPKQNSKDWMVRQMERLERPSDIAEWMTNYVSSSSTSRDDDESFIWKERWTIRDQIEFVKYLASRRANHAMLQFLNHTVVRTGVNNQGEYPVKVYTSALFAIASGSSYTSSVSTAFAWDIIHQMEANGLKPSSLTVIGLLKCCQGPAAVLKTVRTFEAKHPKMQWTAEMYHAAINACRRSRETKRNQNIDDDHCDDDKNWQTAMQLMQQMQRKHQLRPTSATYQAVLQVLAESNKLPLVRAMVRQWRTSNATVDEYAPDDRVWATAMNACARVGDFRQAAEFLEEIQSPNLRHCTSLLMAFANARQDQLAIDALHLMTGLESRGSLLIPDCPRPLTLPSVGVDLVALNTVMSAAAKAGNFASAHELFDRIRNGEFVDPHAQTPLSPDRITYHTLLVSCTDPEKAKSIVQDMRFSRRHRYGAIPPTNVTYAHAIRVCQRADKPNLDTVNLLLSWSNDDGIPATEFMYSPAIWTAQRTGNVERCLELYEEMISACCSVDSSSINGVVACLAESQREDQALEIFDELKNQGFVAFETSLKRLVSAINSNKTSSDEEKERKLLRVLQRMDGNERSVDVGSSVFEALILRYGSTGDIARATEIMHQIEGYMDAACLRAIMLAHATCPEVRVKEAVELLHTSDIVDGAAGPGLIDQVALSHAIVACSRADEFEEGLSLLQLYGIPAANLVPGTPTMTVGALNSLIAACGRGGCPEISLAILNEMRSRFGIRPDSRSYRSTVIACNQAQHGNMIYGDSDETVDSSEEVEGGPYIEWWEIGLSLLKRMDEDGLNPDVQTYSSVISACEAAGQWQRALGVLQSLIDDDGDNDPNNDTIKSISLNLYCWNSAISACEKGGAWVEALDLYERMLETESITPNVVTMNSLLEALDRYGQEDLAGAKYAEGIELGIVNPWKRTKNANGKQVRALDLHRFSAAMTKAALRNLFDRWLDESDMSGGLLEDLVIITGKGLNSAREPVLRETVKEVLGEYSIEGRIDETNSGRVVVDANDLLECFGSKSWR